MHMRQFKGVFRTLGTTYEVSILTVENRSRALELQARVPVACRQFSLYRRPSSTSPIVSRVHYLKVRMGIINLSVIRETEAFTK